MNVLETDRLTIRRFAFGDADFICELVNEPPFLRYIGDKRVRNREDAKRYLETGPMASYALNGFGLWRVGRREDDVPLGMCGLIKRDELKDIDIGFAFLEAHWGHGYALEAAREVVRFAYETLELDRLVAITALDNTRSAHLLHKLGMAFERLIEIGGMQSRLFGRNRAAR